MLTKLKIDYVALSTLVLILGTSPVQAEPNTDKSSPYRLNIEPVKIPEITSPASSIPPNHTPQMYQLQYKYRSQSKPALKTKAELPTAQPLTIKFLDSNDANKKIADLPFSNEIALAAYAASLDPALIHAVIYVESRYQHRAISPKGAVGLMQVLPGTAARYGIRDAIYQPKGNIKAGTLYLRDLMVMFDNRLDLVLAAYNAGEGAVKKYSRQIPPYPETRHYVKAVMAKYALHTGATELSTIDSTNQPAKNDIQETDLLPPVRTQTKYLTGTDLVISNEAFTLNR